ncbi:hypothetical protein N7474_011235 [Penicillium riverlandense]|uniref:uncharacterized protein n=1 Tax=Penicillium riverlandense TaxID=1903569 RepID=UPI002547AC48|nr:uncharacterized protein N7474_011235 [Penicillium riverlandense]KAJ5805348.1 hypothetical protein N7474_011235 [Penicillium riverlandense]
MAGFLVGQFVATAVASASPSIQQALSYTTPLSLGATADDGNVNVDHLQWDASPLLSDPN